MVSGTLRIGVTTPGSTRPSDFLWQRLYLRPLPHQHASFAFGKMAGAVAVTDMGFRIGVSRVRGDPGIEMMGSGSFVRPRSGAPSLSDVSQEEVLAPNGMSPLLNLPSMDADRERIEAHIEAIKKAASGMRADHVLINTAEPLDKALHSYLTFREKRG
jgi:hypothetical protein